MKENKMEEIMSNNLGIEFYNNGFEIASNNNYKFFITYQSICLIDDVVILTKNDLYEPDVCKYAKFNVNLKNGKIIEITSNISFKYYRRIDKSIVGWKCLWMFLTSKLKNLCDDKAKHWLENKQLDMYDAVNVMKDIRLELIEKFNKWNEK